MPLTRSRKHHESSSSRLKVTIGDASVPLGTGLAISIPGSYSQDPENRSN